MEKIILDCQKCGGALEITYGAELFTCKYCGTPYLIKRDNGNVRIIRLEERLEKVEYKQKEQDKEVLSFEIKRQIDEIDNILRDIETKQNRGEILGLLSIKQGEIESKYAALSSLTDKYIKAGGRDREILSYINPCDFIKPLKDAFPQAALTISIQGKTSSIHGGGILIKINHPRREMKISGPKGMRDEVVNVVNDLVRNRYTAKSIKVQTNMQPVLRYIIILLIIAFIMFCIFPILLDRAQALHL